MRTINRIIEINKLRIMIISKVISNKNILLLKKIKLFKLISLTTTKIPDLLRQM